jgi:glycosyltransferase involved in cell wall biosynthesis
MDVFGTQAQAAAEVADDCSELGREAGIHKFQRDIRVRRGQGASPTVSVVIPTLNEARNLPIVLAELPDSIDEVVIVDGHSTDDTVAVARAARPDAILVMQEGRGKGDALRCGFAAAGGEILVMMDADGSADPAEIPLFVKALEEGADFAKGTRFAHNGGSSDITRTRLAGNRMLSATVNILYGTSYTDLCYGYNAFWRRCLPTMSIDCPGFEVETLINIRIGRAGLNVTEVPSFERDRIHGESNLRTFRDGARVLRTIMRERIASSPALGGVSHRDDVVHPQLDYAAEGR